MARGSLFSVSFASPLVVSRKAGTVVLLSGKWSKTFVLSFPFELLDGDCVAPCGSERELIHRFYLEDLLVYWKYPTVYPEQYEYMLSLKRSFDANVHFRSNTHSPTRFPFSTSRDQFVSSARLDQERQFRCFRWLLLTKRLILIPLENSFIAAVLLVRSRRQSKNWYRDSSFLFLIGSAASLPIVTRRWEDHLQLHSLSHSLPDQIFAFTLMSSLVAEGSRYYPLLVAASYFQVDAFCREKTAAWQRERAQQGNGVGLCNFYEGFRLPCVVHYVHFIRDRGGRERNRIDRYLFNWGSKRVWIKAR